MRRKIVAGNWKMNKTQTEAIDLIKSLKAAINGNADVVFCVPFVNLAKTVELLKDSKIAVGAQNMFYEDSGAYTGEISADMLKDIGAEYVIIGHSERRAYFGETDITVNKKVIKALEKSLIPIICVGETLEEKRQGITIDLVRQQTKVALHNVSADMVGDLVIAYEPVWAIGTGETASKEQAQEVCAAIRQVLSEIYDNKTAGAIRIQYGGSVNAGNAAELFSMPDIDGGLVGGASLKDEFSKIVNCIN